MRNSVIMFFVLSVFSCMSLTTKAQELTNKEIRNKLKIRSTREIRKEVRNYKKQGYEVAVGAVPMQMQFIDAWLKQQELDKNGYPRFFVATGNSVGETQIAAKLQATEAAKLDLAGQIASNIAALIENNIANSQLNIEEATSVTKTVAASKNLIIQELGRTIPIVELYRNIGKNVEANVRIAYDNEVAIEKAKNVIRKNLEDETNIMQDKLEKILKF